MSSSSTAGPGGSTTERLQGSLRHSAIARLLVEGRLSSSPAAKDKVSDRRRQVEVHSSPPPPIDLSTNRTSAKQTNANESAAAAAAVAAVAGASFSLSTITTMEKLRCILSYEIQSLLPRGDFNDQTRSGSSSNSSSEHSFQHSCRLCPFAVSNVIELLDHYRLHGDTLAHLGHKSPEILIQWIDYYLKTSPMRCSSAQSLCVVSESMGVMTPSTDNASPPTSRLDLRTLLLKPFKATNALLLTSDRPAPSRHRASSESQPPFRLGCRAAADGGTQSRSSTPYTMISGLTDDENQQQAVVYAGDRCPRRGLANGRQAGSGGSGVYAAGEVVTVKCETDDVATTSPVRSPLSPYSAHSVKDKGSNSQGSQSSGAEFLGQFQNGRVHRLAEEGRMADERSPPTLKCEVDNGGSPYPEDRDIISHCFEIDDKYLTGLRNTSPHPKEVLRKSSNIARLLHPGLRTTSGERSPGLGYGSYPGQSVTPTIDTALEHPEDGHQHPGKESKSPIQFQEAVEQEYAYKQYKRLRKNNAPKSYRQETPSSPRQSLSKTPEDSGLRGTAALPIDGSEVSQRSSVAQVAGPDSSSCRSAERSPRSYDVGVQCSLISPVEPWLAMAEGEEEENDDDEDMDDETREERRSRMRCRARMRVRRKRAFPVDENEMPDITALDADFVQTRCIPCGITFDDDVIFSIHMGCHSHTDPFVCNICGRPCDNKYAFNTHILRGHHPT